MRFLKLAAMAAGLSLAATASAQASIVATFSGHVIVGTDPAGLFGLAGADLTGANASAVFTFVDPPYPVHNGTLDLTGGPILGTSSPLISAFLTVNGTTVSVGSSYLSRLVLENYYSLNTGEITDLISAATNDAPAQTGDYINARYECFYPPQVPTSSCGGSTSFQLAGRTTTGVFAIDSYELSPPFERTGIPEPMTWALMIAGFSMVGASLRRRRAMAT